MIDTIIGFLNDMSDVVVYLIDNTLRIGGLLLIVGVISGILGLSISENFNGKIIDKLGVTLMGIGIVSLVAFIFSLVNPFTSDVYYKPYSVSQWSTIYTNDIGADVTISTGDLTPTLKGGDTLKRDINRSHLMKNKTTNATVTIQKGDESVTRNILIGDMIGEPNQNSKITKIEYRPIDGYHAAIGDHQSWELHKLTDYGEVRITFEPVQPSSELTKLYDGGNKN